MGSYPRDTLDDAVAVPETRAERRDRATSDTRASILAAKTVTIVITGQKKRDLLEQAIADGHSSKLPIGRVLAEAEQAIDIHWCA